MFDLTSQQLLALGIFSVTIAFVVWGIIERSLVSLLGALALGLTGIMGFHDAVGYVDWDVLSILLGMWILAEYMSDAGLPQILTRMVASRVRSQASFIVGVALAAGFASMLVDNVLIVLLFGAIVARVSIKSGVDPLMPVMLVSLNANFMGTALLLGDLPPQLLHSVAGAEFLDFIWMDGRPSSFLLLTATFLILNLGIYRLLASRLPGDLGEVEIEDKVKPGQLKASLVVFTFTVIGMALRPDISKWLGYEVTLGEIALGGGLTMALIGEIMRSRGYAGFDNILSKVEWNALLFYASLFILVGGLEHVGIIERIAEEMIPLITSGRFEAYTIFYWVIGILGGFIEHDALLLTFFKAIHTSALEAGMSPWPYLWGTAWSGTLGSNLTLAGAPAIYVALLVVRRESGKDYRGLGVLRLTVPYALASLGIHYLISTLFWGL